MTNTNIDQAAGGEIPEQVLLSGRAVAQLVTLLDHCHDFLDSSHSARLDLDVYGSRERPVWTSEGVVDQLGWHALLLRLQLAETAHHVEPGQ